MRAYAVTAGMLVWSLCLGQYVGNPTGKARPLSLEAGEEGGGFFGVEGGYTRTDVDADYDVVSGGSLVLLQATSLMRESYFALYGGGYWRGFELEAKLGGSFQEIHEGALSADPFEDGGGILFGMGARWGYAPVEEFRVGFGGQFSYVFSEGDALVSTGSDLFREDIELELWRGEIFGGASLDLPVGPDVVLSPYAGVGAQFLDGEISIDKWDPYLWVLEEDLGDLEQDRYEFFFGGIDLHVRDEFRIGVEGRGNEAGWAVTASVGWRF